MSKPVLQFLELIRTTWRQKMYCPNCGPDTEHTGRVEGLWEIYECVICHAQKQYKVK